VCELAHTRPPPNPSMIARIRMLSDRKLPSHVIAVYAAPRRARSADLSAKVQSKNQRAVFSSMALTRGSSDGPGRLQFGRVGNGFRQA
jgi:hypothetical protein